MARQKQEKRKLPFFYKFGAPYIHDKHYYGKKLYILLALHSIYQSKSKNRINLPYSKK